jgi:NADPH-dependent 2,4-dienoyl-CoA reductase/sulfur reductase-like enzyme
MSRGYDLLVLGAGPAGIGAVLAARRHGLSVAVLDEAPAAGGQIYRAPSYAVTGAEMKANPDLAHGEDLRSALGRSGAHLLLGHRVWFLAPGIQAAALGPAGPVEFEARAIVIATGTTERIVPIPGITAPGVIGLAAATILLKAHAAVPAGPTLVAGVGPLLYAVAAGLLKRGGRVAAVVDLARPGDWLSALPALGNRPWLLARGLAWMARLRGAGVPLFQGHAVSAIHGSAAIEEAEIRPVDRNWGPREGGRVIRIPASGVAIGHGLVPATEALRVLGVRQHFRPERGGWIPELCPGGATPVPGVYVAGDCAGVSGAAAAELAGELAGLTVARDTGGLSGPAYEAEARPVRNRLRRAHRFGSGISRLMTLRPGLVGAIPDETVVCRCEDVTRAAIDRATAAGARHLGQLKSTTRCGMGPCQGRMCGEAAAELVALASGLSRVAVGQWTARTPIRPLPLGQMVGAYSYDDIPRPAPAPA